MLHLSELSDIYIQDLPGTIHSSVYIGLLHSHYNSTWLLQTKIDIFPSYFLCDLFPPEVTVNRGTLTWQRGLGMPRLSDCVLRLVKAAAPVSGAQAVSPPISAIVRLSLRERGRLVFFIADRTV